MNTDILDSKIIEKLLETKTPVEVLKAVDSTNTYMKAKAALLPQGSAVIAESQTLGRGRFTRKFHSPENCGIYMSVLLRPALHIENAVLITAAAATAVSEAIEELSQKDTQIKWVNDILISSKKVCGILAESALKADGMIEHAVVGIGINVYEPEGGFAEDIKDIAGFVFEEKRENLRNRLCAEIINRLLKYSSELERKTFFTHYKNRSTVIGKPITVISGDKRLPAVALDLDSNCRLLVEYPDKTRKYLNSGEISIKL